MSKKYEFTDETITVNGITLHRIKALIDFDRFGVKAGDLGGFIEVEANLSHDGDAWVYENALISGNALVSENAKVSGDAKIKRSNDYACVNGFGSVYKNATFFRCEDDLIRAQCGRFYGTIDEFRAKVKEAHGDSKYAKEYLMIADLMEYHFAED